MTIINMSLDESSISIHEQDGQMTEIVHFTDYPGKS